MRAYVRKTLLRTAAWGLCCLLLIAGDAWAQTVPGAPTITTVEAGRSSSFGLTLVVTWTAPADTGGSDITAYDVRSIETAATDKAAANWTAVDNAWTSGALSYSIPRLTDSTGYDVQVRAVNTTGAGAWSTTETGTTSDHGGSTAEATSLTLDTPMGGVIDALGTDEDYFTFTLTQETGLLIWTTGELDTVGELQSTSGTVLDSNDDENLSQDLLHFSMWQTLDAGTYRIKVSSSGEATGSYTLHTETMVDTSSIADAQEIPFDSAGNGAANGLLDPDAAEDLDRDYFTFTLSAATDLVIHTTGLVRDTSGVLFDSNGERIDADGDGYLWPGPLQFLLRTRLDAGTYFIEVENYVLNHIGPYTLHVNTVTEPGNTIADATLLDFGDFGTAGGGTITASTEEDYFRLVIPETTTVFLAAVSDTMTLDGDVLDSSETPITDDLNVYAAPFGDDKQQGFFLHDRLDAGIYYIKLTRSDGDATGPYTIRAFEDTGHNSFLDRCSNITTTVSDPLYGCQWHLHNTGQLKGGTAGEDINVEAVWTAGNLGAGINVAVVDDGLDHMHEDLSANVDTTRNHDYTDGDGIYDHRRNNGTTAAGIIAARDNSLGVRGVAPRATVYAYNLLRDRTEENEADAATRDKATTAVSNNSWGHYDGPELNAAPSIWEMAVDDGITGGFGGKGIFYTWAAGDGALRGDNSNLSGYPNHYGVTAVCAVNDQGRRSATSEQGANLWVCAPSNDFTNGRQGITTTDNDDFYDSDNFNSTHAATPVVSGVAALIRSANSSLSWRDMKLILAASARQNDPDNTGWEDGALQYGSAPSDPQYYSFNHEYGFGVVDAKGAVDLATNWTLVPALIETTANSTGAAKRVQAGFSPESSITMGSAVEFIEFVEINANFNHPSFRDLQVELVSPSGTVSVLSVPYKDFFTSSTRKAHALRGNFRFGSARHLGEDPAGEWRLRINQLFSGPPGTLESWSLTVYGHRSAPSAPTITTVTPTAIGSLTVAWQEPAHTGASAITAYDVRSIKTADDETDDANWTVVDNAWTSGVLQYTIPGLDADVAYDIQVRAVNGDGDGAWSDTTAEKSSSDAPAFSEGTATTRSVAENAPAGTNVGSPVVATDPTGETLTYTLSGADAGSFAIDAGQLKVAEGAALDHETKPRPAVTVTATDPSENADSITVTITVSDVDEPPTLTGEFDISYAENRILPFAGYDTTDPEGASVSLSLTGTDAGAFFIFTRSGLLRFRNPPDFEHPTDADVNNIYELTVEASDGTNTATQAVTITVTPVDEPHTLTELFRVSSYAENGTGSVAEYSVSDLEENESVTWALAGADRGDFTIAGGVLRFRTPPDFEHPADAGRNNGYEVTVHATAGGHIVPQAVTVRVTPVDEPPMLTGALVPSEVSYAEHNTAQVARYTATDPEGVTVRWSLTGTDADDFTIGESDGRLRFATPPNFEAATDANGDNIYEVIVHASDGTTSPTTQALTVTVENRDETGSLSLSSEQPQVGTALTATLTDPDIVSDTTWVWEQSADKSTWTDIEGAASGSYTPAAADVDKYLRVRVTYTDGHGSDKELSHTATNQVRVAPGTNNGPQFSDTTTTRSVQENTAAGQKVGAPIEATDMDDEPLTYFLDTAGERVFAIDTRSGQLRTKAELDRETQESYAVTVTATDPSQESASIPVTITVEDEDEPPEVTGPSTVRYEENGTAPVYRYTATDPEGETVRWSLTGTDAEDFTIGESDGRLQFRIDPDHEKPQDRNRDNHYLLTVEASAGSLTAGAARHRQRDERGRAADVHRTDRDRYPVHGARYGAGRSLHRH